MKKKSLFLMILVQMAVIPPSEADSGSWLASELVSEKVISSATKEACGKMKSEDLYGGLAFDQLYAGRFPSPKFNQLIHFIFLEEYKKNTVYLLAEGENENELWLLHSRSFEQALAECFPNPRDQAQFKSLVSMRKTAGRTAGMASAGLALAGVSSALSKISVMLYRLWSSAGLVAVGVDSADKVRSALRELRSKNEIQKICGANPKLDCVTNVLTK